MKRKCVCGASIPNNWNLCSECLETYGAARSKWPAWLSFHVSDLKREWNHDRRHDELEYRDEVLYPRDRTSPVKGQYYSPSMGWGPYLDE